jgi:CPA2 family monovalent cation:H+ antiporter-2
VALFFVSLGTLVDPAVLLHSLPLMGFMILLIIAGKFLVWTMVVWLFRYPIKTAILVAAGLTQIGELSFVVMQAARSAGMVAESVFSTVIAASLISILLNVFVVRGAFAWLSKEVAQPPSNKQAALAAAAL